MNKKIKVSKKMFLALEEGLRVSPKEELLKDHMSSGKWIGEEFSIFNTLGILEMAEILINGYELKETPEERLVDFLNFKIRDDFREFDKGIKLGVLKTLDILNIKIKGINE